MKKEIKRIQVIKKMTKGDIKSLGTNRWFNAKIKPIALSVVIWVVWAIIINKVITNDWISVLLVWLPEAAGVIYIYNRMTKAGNKLWNEVKDKPQPVDLG